MSSASFRRLAVTTASTKRPPALAGSKRGPSMPHIAELRCLPIDPINSRTQERLRREGIETPYEALQTMAEGALDIQEGDLLVAGATEYTIRRVEVWTWRGSDYKLLTLEAPKR